MTSSPAARTWTSAASAPRTSASRSPSPATGASRIFSPAAKADKRFDAVICESIDRVARRTYYGTKIEHELERFGIPLFASDEPISLTGKRATAILTRRVKQGVAEWYVLEMLEKSWDGFCEHTRQGWNVGAAPYGYLLEKIPHPVPARRADGKIKSRLVPDPERGPVVHQIFTWRITERLGYRTIAERLNADLDRYQPPVSPDPARRKDYWSWSSAREILNNPKYTGFMVWNRRATKKGGRTNPPEAWVWSPHPTHEPIVTREMFDMAAAVAAHRRGSRNAAAPNRKHPSTKRNYVLRSFVVCDLCSRRMFGKTFSGNRYYACQPRLNLGPDGAKRRHPDHPPAVYVREDRLWEGTIEFLSEKVFGPDRREKFEDKLSVSERKQDQEREGRIKRLRAAIDKLGVSQTRLVKALEKDNDPAGVVFARIRERLVEIEKERRANAEELRALEAASQDRPIYSVDLLDSLPLGRLQVPKKPEEAVHRFFEALQLKLRYEPETNLVHCTITLREDSIDEVLRACAQIVESGASQPRTDALRAPGGNRTKPPNDYPGSGSPAGVV